MFGRVSVLFVVLQSILWVGSSLGRFFRSRVGPVIPPAWVPLGPGSGPRAPKPGAVNPGHRARLPALDPGSGPGAPGPAWGPVEPGRPRPRVRAEGPGPEVRGRDRGPATD